MLLKPHDFPPGIPRALPSSSLPSGGRGMAFLRQGGDLLVVRKARDTPIITFRYKAQGSLMGIFSPLEKNQINSQSTTHPVQTCPHAQKSDGVRNAASWDGPPITFQRSGDHCFFRQTLLSTCLGIGPVLAWGCRLYKMGSLLHVHSPQH